MADKITLIDTVKAPFMDEMLARIASVVDPAQVDYIVSNHSEMDHSGGLPRAVQVMQPSKVFASAMGVKALGAHFGTGLAVQAVKEGEELDLGGRRLRFMETWMLHWPDSMFSYLLPDKLLFSQDAFGMHLASSERFADELDGSVLEYEAGKYYANILLPFSSLVVKLLDKVKTMGLEIGIIAPDHGPIWRKDVGRMPGLYAQWAERKPTMKAVVTYDTMWHSTELMARAIGEGLVEGGASAKDMPLGVRHRSDVMAEILDAGALLVGTPTINNHMFPTVADFLTYASGLKPKGLVGVAFGSFGWSGEGARQVKDHLAAMNVELVAGPLECKYVPGPEDLARCRALGVEVARRLKLKCGT
jgi:flavorubredoxin